MIPIRFSLIVSLSSLLILPNIIACAPIVARSNNTSTQIASQVSEAELRELAESITVKVLAGNNPGSGVLIAKVGQVYTILTNAHVTTPGETYRIQTPDGTIHLASLVSRGDSVKGNDLAVLQFNAKEDYAVAEMATTSELAQGVEVFAAGFPFDSEQLRFTSGKISLLSDKPLAGGYQIGYTNDILQGMSGGPILNQSGKLIGVNGKIAFAINDSAYRFADGSRPSASQLQQMRDAAWGVPIETIATVAPQLAAMLQQKTHTPNLTGVAAKVDAIADKITVLITSPNGNGSGVIIARLGNTYYVLTAAHVVEKKEDEVKDKEDEVKDKEDKCKHEEDKYSVVTHDGQQHGVSSATVTCLNSADLAVLQFSSNQTYPVATLAKYNLGYEEKRWIFLSGFPKVKSGSVNKPGRRLSAGIVYSKELGSLHVKNLESLTDINGYGLVYTNISQPGMSGGAVLDSRGRLIGIHAAAEAEQVIQESGSVASVNLGRSLGVPIATFLGVANRANVKPQWLTVESAKTPTLTDEEINSIRSGLFTLETPLLDASEIDWLNYGNQLWRIERYSEAVAAFDKAIKILPDFYLAYYARGLALTTQSKDQEAIASFEKATEINPRFYEAWRERSRSLYSLDKYPEALADIDKAIALKPSDWFLYTYRSNILNQLSRFPEAIEAANRAIALHPEHTDAYTNRAFAYSFSGEPDKAFADFNRALQINPENEFTYSSRGAAYLKLKNYQKAIADFNRALQVNSEFYWAYLGRGNAYKGLEKYDEAVSDYDSSIKINPEYAKAYVSRGNAYNELKEYSRAISDYTQAIKIEPENALAYRVRGVIYFQLEKYALALADLNQALQLQPDYADAYFLRNEEGELEHFKTLNEEESHKYYSYLFRGYAYTHLGESQKAIADFTSAIRLNPEESGSYTYRGVNYRILGKYELALADFERDLQLTKNNNAVKHVIYNYRGEVYLEVKEYSQAISDFTAAIKLNPEFVLAFNNRGRAYLQLEKYDLAIADATKAIQINPQFAEAYWLRGNTYYKKGDYQLALVDYEQAIAQNEKLWQAYVNIGLVKYEMGEVEAAISQWQKSLEISSEQAEPELAIAVALYGQGKQEQGLKMAQRALRLDSRLANVEYLHKNLWGNTLIADAQKLLENSRLRSHNL